MQYNRCGRSGVLLPKVSLGFWHNFGSVDPFDRSRELVRYAFDHGITQRIKGTGFYKYQYVIEPKKAGNH